MFDGKTYEPEHDRARLSTQLDRVKDYMKDQEWHDIEEIRNIAGGTSQSISARIRDLRKPKFGGWVIDRRRVGNKKRGLFQYRMTGEQIKTQVMIGTKKVREGVDKGRVRNLEKLIREAAPYMDEKWNQRACRALGVLFL